MAGDGSSAVFLVVLVSLKGLFSSRLWIMAIRVSARRSLSLLVRSSPHRCFSCPPTTQSKSNFARQISLAGLLRRHGLPSSHLREFLQKNDFLLHSTSLEIESSIRELLSFGLSQKSFLSVVSLCPRSLELGYLTRWLEVFSDLGLSSTSSAGVIQMVLEQSARCRIEPEEFLRHCHLMRSAGLGTETMTRVFEELPTAFMNDGIDFKCRIDFLKEVVGIKADEELNRICQSYPAFLAFSINTRLRPLFAELSELEFDRNEIRNFLIQNPRLLLDMEPGELSRCVNLLNGLKCRIAIKKRILARGRLPAAIDVKLRIDFLSSHGLTRRDAFKILHVEPRSILYSTEELGKKMEFFLQKMGFCIDHLVEFPDFLGVNLEKQIVPRFQVMGALKSMGGLGMEVGLKHLVRFSRREFYNFFVKPYPECEQIFGGLVRESKVDQRTVKPKYPTGLWKLFKPKKFSDSEEDVKNLK
ncbi:hypothetical protein AXF42_Ash012340 [Apostasia shenzhenica]|uniref:mTERF domain-containing protein 1, mitochondrial n=1 Tax=Apostasia shenzhenica TaxID=1088818 RepID=A0A2I0ACW7_9ASPA|nr:hypothetical protein AXF42_Ash012340 [Apostasia shenzhenica]